MRVIRVLARGARHFRIVLLAVVIAAAATGCGAQPAARPAGTKQTATVVVAAVPASGASGLYIAQDDGLFRAAGLRVVIESSASAADAVPDLIGGSVDVALGQWTSALAAGQAGVDLEAVAPGNSAAPGLEELVTGTRSRITSLRQLAGQTVAVNALSGLSQALAEN